LDDGIPGRGLLPSSSSSLRGDPTDEDGPASIELGLEVRCEGVFGELGTVGWWAGKWAHAMREVKSSVSGIETRRHRMTDGEETSK